jgi:alpha-L-rhamnosidase
MLLRPAALLLAFSLTLGALAAPPTAPTQLIVDDVANPIGTRAQPFFGWRVNDPDANELQSKYQVRVATSASALASGRADVWDSGEVASRDQNHVAYAGPALAADRQYFWQVRTWDKGGAAGPFSAPARFVVGPLTNEDWSGASWIRRTNNDPDDYTYFRKTAELPARPIQRATVYITSVHKYELFVNGQLIGKGPAYHYPQFQYYNGFDITAQVKPGANLFAVLNHWFGGGQGRATSARGLLMKAVVHYADGSTVVVGTDGAWKQIQAPQWVLGQRGRNPGEGVGFIERIDARKLIPNWNQPGFDDSSWAVADVVGPQPTAPWINAPQPDYTRIVEKETVPVSVKPLGEGAYLVDFGRVYSGVPRIAFTGGEPGQLVTMMGGYMLGADGRVDPTKNQNTNLGFFAELSGAPFTYAPIEYVGMRYLQIENSPMPVTAANCKFLIRHMELDEARSTFDSPNATLNAVWALMKHSLTAAAQEEYVDTPSREKGGFLGDSAIMSAVAMPVFRERLLTRRQLNEFIASMDQFWATPANRGRMNAVYPNNDNGRDIPDYTQAYLVWAWTYFMETGDARFLRERYNHLKDIAEYVYRSRSETTGLITDLPGGGGQYVRGIIDWPASMRYGYDMRTAARAVINHWAVADFEVMSKIAAAVGNTADSELYRTRAEDLKKAINTKLLNAEGIYIDGLANDGAPSSHASQHANMFPLALGFVPEAQRASVSAKVKDMKMSVGMVTVLFLVRAIGEIGDGEHLIEMFTNADWPAGWANSMKRGATITWETWNSDTDGTSQSHAWGAAGLDGYIRYILGIRPTKPGYEEVAIKPLAFGTKLPFARGSIGTDRGDIGVEWTRSATNYRMNVTLPVNVTSFVYVPKGAATNNTVRVNGANVAGEPAGDYLRVPVGSGAHTIERALAP